MFRTLQLSILLVAASVAPVYAQNDQWTIAPDTKITLQRSGCQAQCSDYTVNVYADGYVEYEEAHTVDRLSVVKVRQLVAAFKNIGFFELQNSYATEKDGCTKFEPGNSTVRMSIQYLGLSKEVTHNRGCSGPAVLPTLTDFENRIASIIGSNR